MIVCKRPVAPDDHLQELCPSRTTTTTTNRVKGGVTRVTGVMGQKEEREEKKGGGEEIVEGKIAADGTGSNRLQVDRIKIKSFFCNKSGCPLAF